eukprot:SM000076S21862  [mRNA]  locus=s76:540276:544794:- [translate_table: standard]
MAHYLGTVAGGLELLAADEILSASMLWSAPAAVVDSLQGYLLFDTAALPQDVTALRSLDNVYHFLLRKSTLPLTKDAAAQYLPALASEVDWQAAEAVFWQWQGAAGHGRYDSPPQTLAFRVTCTRTCRELPRHGYTSEDAAVWTAERSLASPLAALIGAGIHMQLGWRVDMRQFDVEIIAWICDSEIILAMCLLYGGQQLLGGGLDEARPAADLEDDPSACCRTGGMDSAEPGDRQANNKTRLQARARSAGRQLYSQRTYRKALSPTALRPSVAYGLLQMADIKPGHVMLDPMCGCGTISLEAAGIMGSSICTLGADLKDAAVAAARVNVMACFPDCTNLDVAAGQTGSWCDVLQWDATHMPLRSDSIDRVICDMPFGNRSGTFKSRERLGPKVVQEVIRTLKLTTGEDGTLGVAVLMCQGKTMRHEIEIVQRRYLQLQKLLPLEMEGLRVDVYILHRTPERWTHP